ncbi:MAG TPA: GNAT family N-acetyltransferase [Syntrophomonadaceae bacterium]|nr:GNAT family N-acetyltransferase [Syntrophomonadaceae bacterium]
MANERELESAALILSSSEAWTCYGIHYDEALGLLRAMPDQIFIAEHDQAVIGLITLRNDGVGNIGAYVRMLAVAPDLRGQGIGVRLLDFASQIASQEQPNLFLICSTDNAGAQRFYERNGFEAVGIMKDLVVSGHHEIFYRKAFATLR